MLYVYVNKMCSYYCGHLCVNESIPHNLLFFKLSIAPLFLNPCGTVWGVGYDKTFNVAEPRQL